MAKRFSFVGQADDSKKVCANKTNLQTKLVRTIFVRSFCHGKPYSSHFD